jgi:mutator protein MutT
VNARKVIGIAVVERDGAFLVGVRPESVPLAGFAEFPGGKCEPGEPPNLCAARECLEETGLSVTPVRLLERVEWDYAHGGVELHFWLCRPSPGGAPHPPFRWTPRAELAALRFPDANAKLISTLTRTQPGSVDAVG